MDLQINVHNMEMTPRLENYVEKKTARLDRYMPNLGEVRVDLTEQKARNAVERQVAQITVRDTRGTVLRAEERSSDIFAAIDTVIDKLYRQIKRYQGKRRRSRRSGADDWSEMEPLPLADEVAVDDVDASIVRRKRFPLMPMSPEEAIDQMELLGHDFFVFFSVEDETTNVVYRRRDNTYGLLQPELS